MKKLRTLDLIYFIGKSHFQEHSTQNYLVFQPIQRYCKRIASDTEYILSCKPKGLSNEGITPPATSNNSLTPALSYYGTKTRNKIYWKLFETIYSWKNSKHLHCL